MSSLSSDPNEFLNELLQCVSGQGALQKEQCSHLTDFFSPNIDAHVQAKATVALSAAVHHYRHLNSATKDEESGTHNIVHAFQSAVDRKLSEVEEEPLLEVLSFVSALIAVDWKAGISFFIRDGFQDMMMDALDIFPTPGMRHVISVLLAAAFGYKDCRTCASSRCIAWLDLASQSVDAKLKWTTSLALLKLSQGSKLDEEALPQGQGATSGQDERQSALYSTFRDALIANDGHVYTVLEPIEGLAYISASPTFKELISKDTPLLLKLTGLRDSLQKRHARTEELGTAPFGLASLVANLATYKPKLSAEQEQIAKLKKMSRANASRDAQGPPEDLDTDEHVRQRAKRMVDAGAAELLVSIAQVAESAATKAVVALAFLGLIEDKSNRGRILQAGGAKALTTIIRDSQREGGTKSSNQSLNVDTNSGQLVPIQALAKLAITSSPLQVFGPSENASIDAIKPFSRLLLQANSTLLQKFESLMALTNLSSSGPNLADRIAHTEGILNKLEFLLLDDNTMVRRAAAELVCNLVSGSEYAFNRCTGDGVERDGDKSTGSQAKSRLHVLIALSDVEDEPTRLAASGSLAVLTGSPNACKLITLLEIEHHRVFPVLKRLLDPTSDEDGEGGAPKDIQGLMHRGVVSVRNLLYNLEDESLKARLLEEAIRQGLIDTLAGIIKAGQGSFPEHILQPTAEALKWLVESGSSLLQ